MTSPKQTHRWVVDVIEESAASIEVDGGAMMTVPRALLPAKAREGLILRVEHEESADGRTSTLTIEIDEEATKKALAESAAQVKKGSKQKNDPGGNIIL